MKKDKFDGKKVKVLVKQIITMVNLYEAHEVGEGTLRIVVETLLSEIERELKKLGK